jgi:hypothetical protein
MEVLHIAVLLAETKGSLSNPEVNIGTGATPDDEQPSRSTRGRLLFTHFTMIASKLIHSEVRVHEGFCSTGRLTMPRLLVVV